MADPKGLPVSGVSIVVKNLDSGISSTYPTNDSGIYSAPYLQPGTYEITATAEGFAPVTHKDVVIHVSDRLTIDAQLPLQGQQTSVTGGAGATCCHYCWSGLNVSPRAFRSAELAFVVLVLLR